MTTAIWPDYARIVADGLGHTSDTDVARTPFDDGLIRQERVYTNGYDVTSVTAIVQADNYRSWQRWAAVHAHGYIYWLDPILSMYREVRIRGGRGGISARQRTTPAGASDWEVSLELEGLHSGVILSLHAPLVPSLTAPVDLSLISGVDLAIFTTSQLLERDQVYPMPAEGIAFSTLPWNVPQAGNSTPATVGLRSSRGPDTLMHADPPPAPQSIYGLSQWLQYGRSGAYPLGYLLTRAAYAWPPDLGRGWALRLLVWASYDNDESSHNQLFGVSLYAFRRYFIIFSNIDISPWRWVDLRVNPRSWAGASEMFAPGDVTLLWRLAGGIRGYVGIAAIQIKALPPPQ